MEYVAWIEVDLGDGVERLYLHEDGLWSEPGQFEEIGLARFKTRAECIEWAFEAFEAYKEHERINWGAEKV